MVDVDGPSFDLDDVDMLGVDLTQRLATPDSVLINIYDAVITHIKATARLDDMSPLLPKHRDILKAKIKYSIEELPEEDRPWIMRRDFDDPWWRSPFTSTLDFAYYKASLVYPNHPDVVNYIETHIDRWPNYVQWMQELFEEPNP